ncbi:MAG: polysaccharide deacetylase family protein [Acidiferrobacterales bacterium]
MRTGDVQVNTFNAHMRVLSRYFNVLSLSEAVAKLQQGSLPARAVCVTFDDGYADNYHLALPILRHWDLPATFFIATDFLDGGRMWNDTVIEAIRNVPEPTVDLTGIGLGRYDIASSGLRHDAALALLEKLRYLEPERRQLKIDAIAQISGNALPTDLMMRPEQVRRLSDSGMDIGAHTVTHPILASLDDRAAHLEIAASRQRLETITRREVTLFAYPSGKPDRDYAPRHVTMVSELGFIAAVSTTPGAATRSTDVYQLPRLPAWHPTPVRFVLSLLRHSLTG